MTAHPIHHHSLTPPIPDMGLLPQAVALQEAGILLHGLMATDLLTGYCVQAQPPEEGADTTTFRSSSLTLAHLEVTVELLQEVLAQRADAGPELAHPPAPRDRFPWGVDAAVPDIVIAGDGAQATATFLQLRGFRARVVDATASLHIAAELAVAEQEWEAMEPWLEHTTKQRSRTQQHRRQVHSQERESERTPWTPLENQPARHAVEVSEKQDGQAIDRAGDTAPPSLRLPVAVACSLVAVCAAGGLAFLALRGTSETQSVAAGEQALDTLSASSPAVSSHVDDARTESSDGGVPTSSAPWAEHHINGQSPVSGAVERAKVPTRAAVPGWRRVGATAAREEYRGPDEGMRVLIAATPVPVKTQQELDQAVVNAVGGAQGVHLVNSAPVSYREEYQESATVWHVRLVDGFQVSVGCQCRGETPQRLATCAEFAATAGPEVIG